jgi:hypothetical protein
MAIQAWFGDEHTDPATQLRASLMFGHGSSSIKFTHALYIIHPDGDFLKPEQVGINPVLNNFFTIPVHLLNTEPLHL